MPPLLLAHLSDSHIGADWGEPDPVARLSSVIDAIARLDPRPAAVLVSGDLAETAADAEYEPVRELLASLELPVHVLPGNHDDRAALRRHFDLPGTGGEPIQYAVDVGALRLVMVDSTLPGEDPGELGAERLAWLDGALGERADAATVVAMHHPPIVTGMPPIDALGLPEHDRRALAAVIERHPQVQRIVAGHVHRTITARLGACPVLIVPSTYMQLRLDFRSDELAMTREPAGFAVHALRDGEVVSHVRVIG